jgi:excisionase family DNA binding protein
MRNTTKPKTPAKTVQTPAQTRTTSLPAFAHIPPVIIQQPDGAVLVKPGKPQIDPGGEFVTTARFAKLTGLSQRHVTTLCDEGKIQFRRKSPKPGSRYLIPASEVERYRNISETEE